MMRAIEFKSKIRNQSIYIPQKIQEALKDRVGKNIRVIVFLEDSDTNEDDALKQTAREQLLKGYEDSDAVYDNY